MKQILIIVMIVITISCNNHEEEVKAISDDIRISLEKDDLRSISNLVAYNKLLEDAFLELEIPFKYTRQLTKNIKKSYTLEKILRPLVDAGHQIKVVSSNHEKITLGIYKETHFVNYIDLKLLKYKSGWRVNDYYSYNEGISASEQISLSFKHLKGNLSNPIVAKYSYTLQKINTAFLEGDYLSAQTFFNEIPKEFIDAQKTKALAIIITANSDPSNVNLLIEDYIKKNPDAKQYNAYLRLMSSVYLTKCGKMDAAIKELWKYTGVDSSTLSYREECVLEM